MPMYDDAIMEKLDEMFSLIRILDTRIQFLQQDIEDLKQDELYKIKRCVEQLAQQQLDTIQEKEVGNWVVERF